MIAKKTVYLETEAATGAPGKLTTEPPKQGQVIIREGAEIVEAQLARYPGALEMAGGTKKAPEPTPEPTPEPEAKKAPKGEDLQTQEPAADHDRQKSHRKGH